MAVTFLFGQTEITPTPTESIVFGLGFAGMVYGIWNGRWAVATGGGLVAGTVAFRMYEKASEVKSPDTFNGHFLTGGKYSAMDGLEGADKVRRVLGLKRSHRQRS